MLKKIAAYFRLWGEKENFEELYEKVMEDIPYRGTNLWILIFAIVIASVGLNIDSIPVVIGAMLISPLMGPINGLGFGIATNDMTMIRRAGMNLGFAVLASVIASCLYFLITPISGASPQLISRTTPTVYDGIVAFFGGMAGMLALGSRLKGNVIPGVAIATALLPPLCTAGFGLATWQMRFLWGSLYLFMINTVCIVVAGLLIAQIVKFPIRRDISDKKKKRINTIITVAVVLTIVPSFYLAYRLLQREEFKGNAGKFIKEVSFLENNYLVRSDIDARKGEIELVYAGIALTQAEKDSINVKAEKFFLNNSKIHIEEGVSFGSVGQGKDSGREVDNLNKIIEQAHRQRDSLLNIPKMGKNLLSEITAFYPQIDGCSYSETTNYLIPDSLSCLDRIIVMTTKEDIGAEEQNKIRQWITSRLGQEKVRVYFETAGSGN